jgi:hypothetical protein
VLADDHHAGDHIYVGLKMPPLRLQPNREGNKRLPQMSRQGSTSSRRERGNRRPDNVCCLHGSFSTSPFRVFYALASGGLDAVDRAGAGDVCDGRDWTRGNRPLEVAALNRDSALHRRGLLGLRGSSGPFYISSRTVGHADISRRGSQGWGKASLHTRSVSTPERVFFMRRAVLGQV